MSTDIFRGMKSYGVSMIMICAELGISLIATQKTTCEVRRVNMLLVPLDGREGRKRLGRGKLSLVRRTCPAGATDISELLGPQRAKGYTPVKRSAVP